MNQDKIEVTAVGIIVKFGHAPEEGLLLSTTPEAWQMLDPNDLSEFGEMFVTPPTEPGIYRVHMRIVYELGYTQEGAASPGESSFYVQIEQKELVYDAGAELLTWTEYRDGATVDRPASHEAPSGEIPAWDIAPAWAKWRAMDSDGEFWWFSKKPETINSMVDKGVSESFLGEEDVWLTLDVGGSMKRAGKCDPADVPESETISERPINES